MFYSSIVNFIICNIITLYLFEKNETKGFFIIEIKEEIIEISLTPTTLNCLILKIVLLLIIFLISSNKNSRDKISLSSCEMYNNTRQSLLDTGPRDIIRKSHIIFSISLFCNYFFFGNMIKFN